MEFDLPHQVADLMIAEAAFRTLEPHSVHGWPPAVPTP